MNIQKILLQSTFFALFFPQFALAMLAQASPGSTVPSLSGNSNTLILYQGDISLHKVAKTARRLARATHYANPGQLTLRLRTSTPAATPPPVSTPTPAQVPPAPTPLSAMRALVAQLPAEFKQKFHAAAPALAMAAYVAQHANFMERFIFGRSHEHTLALALNQLNGPMPPDLRTRILNVMATLQRNAFLENMINNGKQCGWQLILSMAMWDSRFNENYSKLQLARDLAAVAGLFDPYHRPGAHNYLLGRAKSESTSVMNGVISKGLVSAYKRLSSLCFGKNTSIKKTVIDTLAVGSIHATTSFLIAPTLMNYCTKPNSPLVIWMHQKALRVYNYLPRSVKENMLAIKNWYTNFLHPQQT